MSNVLEENARSFSTVAYGARQTALLESLARRVTDLERAQTAQESQPQLNNAGIDNLIRNSDFAYSINAYTGAGSTDNAFGWCKGVDVAQPVGIASTGAIWDKVNGWLQLTSKALADDLSYQFPKRLLLPGVTYYLIFSAKLADASNTTDLSLEVGAWDKTVGKDNWITGALVGSESSNAPVLTIVGAPGVTTYKYKIVATLDSGETLVSAEATTTTGNGTLDATHYVQIDWVAVGGALEYRVYRTAGGTTGLIAQIKSGTNSFKDQGATLVANATPPPSTAPQAKATVEKFGAQLSSTEWRAFAVQFRVPGGYALGQTDSDKQFLRIGLRSSASSVPTVLMDRLGLSIQPGGWAAAIEDRLATGDISINPPGDGGQGGTTIKFTWLGRELEIAV